ncbi:exodeoxyribonuclease V subunit gamma [Mycobacterium sp.]|uniref:exodeoxyribonuclease V subunit gamma n=1 Tax=Mycobacterium sp. TaxID=1785 RepID=UPI003A84B4A3
MALHLHRADRTDLLADGLAALLAEPPADPFAGEIVLVPAPGVERWLSQRLSHRLGASVRRSDGVCAGVSFRSPAWLIAEITGTADDDPWSPEAMVWPLLEVLDRSLDEPWCRTVAQHLGHFDSGDESELRQGRRYSVARRLAGLFASYARERPELLAGWLTGDTSDHRDLDSDLTWQPQLWRALVRQVPADPPHIRQQQALARLRNAASDLPARLSLFGHARLASSEVALLTALATHHELHLWLPHPSEALWRSLAGGHGAVPRHEDATHREVAHPLLATLGRDLRELQRGLPPDPATDECLDGIDRPQTLLGWLQSDLAADAVRPEGRTLAADDRSVQAHSCHGPARQVDVLREVLLGLLADDPTLEPRDILVLCPDIETYAPLIVAGFGVGLALAPGDTAPGAHPAHRLRVQLADHSLLQANPLLAMASELLALAGGRVTAGEVLNLAKTPPVRARFAFDDDDLEDIAGWVRQSNIRWGFDQAHRAPFGVDFVHDTWRFGMDRILAGVAMSDSSAAWIGSTLPLDDVGSNRIELAGRFAEYIDRLRRVVASLTGTQPVRDWLAALADGIGLLALVPDDDAWQTAQMQREFAEVLNTAGPRSHTPMRLTDIRALLRQHLAGRPTRVNFRSGSLTVCAMTSLRSVPHRVICLVGLDDGAFGRTGVVDGDDVLARHPLTGERDPRSEDRQLMLDAIGAATGSLVITYTGADQYSGRPRPPAVPLAELLDTLDVTTTGQIRSRILTEHPLQPFDVRNVEPGRLVPGVPFSFDPTVLRAARSATGNRGERPKFVSGPLPSPAIGDVDLDDLVSFFKDPVKGFFRALDYTLPWKVDGTVDGMPVDIDALGKWTVGERMLHDILGGMDPDQARQAEWRRGTVPPGRLGWRTVTEIRDQAALLATAAQEFRRADPVAYDVDIDLGSRRLTGTVPQVFADGLVSVTYSKLDGKHLIEPWIRLLALFSHAPDRAWSAICIGRAKQDTTPRERVLGRADREARDVLAELVAIYDAGRREPIPLPLKTSYAWAEARHTGDYPQRAANYRWQSGQYPGDDAEPAHVRAWGRQAPLADLMQPVRPGEEFPGEDNRLGAYAARLWLPILRAESPAGRNRR